MRWASGVQILQSGVLLENDTCTEVEEKVHGRLQITPLLLLLVLTPRMILVLVVQACGARTVVDGVGRDESRREVVHVSEASSRPPWEQRWQQCRKKNGRRIKESRSQRKHSPGLSRMGTVLERGKAAVVPADGALES